MTDANDGEKVDDETHRNTSYNETQVISVRPIDCCTGTSSDLHGTASTTMSGNTPFSAASQCPTSTAAKVQSAIVQAPQITVSTFASPTSTSRRHTETSRPVGREKTVPAVPPKPTVCCRPSGTGWSPGQPRPPTWQAPTFTGHDENAALLATVHTYDKVCNSVVVLLFRNSLK